MADVWVSFTCVLVSIATIFCVVLPGKPGPWRTCVLAFNLISLGFNLFVFALELQLQLTH